MQLKKDIKEFVIVVFVAVVLVFLMNIEYFWKNAVYFFDGYRSPTVEQANNLDKEPPKLEPDTLWIESLSVKAPVQYVDKVDESLFQKALQKGVVHYPGTANPGEVGNDYIFGHSSDNAWSKGDYKTIFAVLPQIQIGAEILITDVQGREFQYIVTDSKVVSAKAVEYLSQDTKGKKILTLQTSYPVGTSFKRWVVTAELIE